jgi:hypothetical protein
MEQAMRQKPTVYTRPSTARLWIRYYDAQGHLIRRSSGTEDQATAQLILEECLKQVAAEKAQRLKPDQLKVTFTAVRRVRVNKRREREWLKLTEKIVLPDVQAIEPFLDVVRRRLEAFLEAAPQSEQEKHPEAPE